MHIFILLNLILFEAMASCTLRCGELYGICAGVLGTSVTNLDRAQLAALVGEELVEEARKAVDGKRSASEKRFDSLTNWSVSVDPVSGGIALEARSPEMKDGVRRVKLSGRNRDCDAEYGTCATRCERGSGGDKKN